MGTVLLYVKTATHTRDTFRENQWDDVIVQRQSDSLRANKIPRQSDSLSSTTAQQNDSQSATKILLNRSQRTTNERSPNKNSMIGPQ